ncbi:MAG: transcription termination/antitermination protein NusG [Patescibacteria group bacterium]|nr:transcription termination/antitermination protein NusG [Patescibacteria group bacterium]
MEEKENIQPEENIDNSPASELNEETPSKEEVLKPEKISKAEPKVDNPPANEPTKGQEVTEVPVEEAVSKNVFNDETPGQWYVLHTYSGYEDAVADSLRQRIESLDMEDKIFHVLVPKEKQIEIKNGKRKTVEKKIFPGYVLVKMVVTEASWYVVRNTPSVTGFIGSGTVPVPIADTEMDTIKKRMVVEEPKHKIDLKVGELVHINDGPFKEYDGTVGEVDEARGKIKVMVSIFGRETPVELDFLQVKRA